MARAQEVSPVVTVDHGPNAAIQLAKPYVILISLDGFRYDYAKRYGAKNLLELASRGASAPEGMIPAFPSITFPSHYTIVTGLYPEHHGIVGNVFYDPARKQVYSYRDASTVTDGSWYGGTPLWVLAEAARDARGMLFLAGVGGRYSGSAALLLREIQRHFPERPAREQVLAWLRLPAPGRRTSSRFISAIRIMRDTSTDPTARRWPARFRKWIRELGKLSAGIQALQLPVDEIVVSDHGMANVAGDWVNLDELGLDVSLLEKYEGQFLYAKSDADAQKIFESLEGKSEKFQVYRRGAVARASCISTLRPGGRSCDCPDGTV